MINQRLTIKKSKKPLKVEGHCQFCKKGLCNTTFHFLYIVNNRIRFFLDKNEVYSSIPICIKCLDKCKVIINDFEFQKDIHNTIKLKLIEKLKIAIKNYNEYSLSSDNKEMEEQV